jgi:hypothetical protein
VEHGAVDDAARQIRGIAAAREVLHGITVDPALFVEAHLPVAAEVVALAGEDEIIVAVEPELAWPARHPCRERRDGGPLRRLALLAPEAPAHAAGLAGHVGIRDVEHPRHDVLHLARVLGRGIDVEVAVLARDRERDLALEVEVLLAADAKRAAEPVRRRRDRARRVAASERVVGKHGLAALQRVLHGDARALGFDLHHGELRGAAGDIPIRRHHGEHRLAVEADGILDEHRIVPEGGRDVVLARHVGGREHRDDALRGANGGQVEGDEPPARLRGLPDRHVQRALGLADVVDVLRQPLDVLARRIVRQRPVDVAEHALAVRRRVGSRQRSRVRDIGRRPVHCRYSAAWSASRIATIRVARVSPYATSVSALKRRFRATSAR